MKITEYGKLQQEKPSSDLCVVCACALLNYHNFVENKSSALCIPALAQKYCCLPSGQQAQSGHAAAPKFSCSCMQG